MPPHTVIVTAFLAVAAALATGARAQTITWLPPSPTLAVSDVSLNGTPVMACNLHAPGAAQSPTANGVTFTGGLAPSGWGGYVTNGLQGSTTGDAGYDALLNTANATTGPTGNPTGWGAIRLDTLAAFVVGRNYEIQCWYTDQRLGTATNVLYDRVMTLSSAVGPAILAGGEVSNLSALVQGPLSGPLDADPDNNPALGGVDVVFGSYCLGYFTWMNPTDQLWLLVQGSHPIAANVLRPHLTAFQVREIGNVFATATPYGSGCGGLALAASARPVANGAISLVSSGITPAGLFGAVAFGLAAYPTPIDLGVVGMPGCHQYHGIGATMLYLPLGASTVATPLLVPDFVGWHLHAQSFHYDPAAALTPLGAVSSNALDLLIGDY